MCNLLRRTISGTPPPSGKRKGMGEGERGSLLLFELRERREPEQDRAVVVAGNTRSVREQLVAIV